MARIIIPGFQGGQAIDSYDSVLKQTYQTSRDLQVYVNSKQLAPHRMKLQVTAGNPTITGGSDYRFFHSFTASNGKTYFVGEALIAAATNLVLWSTATLGDSTYAAEYNINTGSPGSVLEEYKNGILFSWGTNLDRWGDLSGSPSRSNLDNGLDSVATYILNHRLLGNAYFVHGKKIGMYDGSSVVRAKLTLQQADTIVGLQELGKWVIIGVNSAGSARSRFLIWDGDSVTYDDAIDLGDVGLQGFRVVNGEIRYITMTASGSVGNDTIRLYTVVLGGRPQLIEERTYVVTTGSALIHPNAFSTIGDLFFYGFAGSTYNFDLGVFAYGSASAKTPRFSTLWRLVHTGATTGVSIRSINYTGSNLVVIWSTLNGSGTWFINVTNGNGITLGPTANGVYRSDIFPMDGALGLNPGNFQSVLLNHLPLPTSNGFSVWLRQFGNYGMDQTTINSDDYFTFTVSGVTVSPVVGATYTNNSSTFTVRYTLISGGVGYVITKRTSGTNSPSSTTLTKTAGTGDSTITFSANTNFIPVVTNKGSGGIVGITQSENGSTYTKLKDFLRLENSLWGQLEIRYDEISSTTPPTIVFPITIDTNTTDL